MVPFVRDSVLTHFPTHNRYYFLRRKHSHDNQLHASPIKSMKTKYYAVKVPMRAIFTSWSECHAVVNGAGNATFKSFSSLDEARAFVEDGLESQQYTGKKSSRESHGLQIFSEQDLKDCGMLQEGIDEEREQNIEGLCANSGAETRKEYMERSSTPHTDMDNHVCGTGGARCAANEERRKRKRTKEEHAQDVSQEQDAFAQECGDAPLTGRLGSRIGGGSICTVGMNELAGEGRGDQENEDDDFDDESSRVTEPIPAIILSPNDTSPNIPSEDVSATALLQRRPRFVDAGVLFFDGGARGNPGVSGGGAVMFDCDNKQLWTLSVFLGSDKTNNQAEYLALYHGLEEAARRGVRTLHARGDSLLVIRQMEGVWKVKNKAIMRLHAQVKALARRFRALTFQHVPRAENIVADALANAAMDKRHAIPVVEEAGLGLDC